MRGIPKVIDLLNSLLADELAAQNQYLAHYGALKNWGIDGLAALVKDRANDERNHADSLVDRILALEGIPNVAAIGKIEFTVSDVVGQFGFDASAELRAIESYNAAISACEAYQDFATAEILRRIVSEKIDHLNEIEGWQDQIGMMGLPAFLTARIKS